ncbi:MAG: LamG domain-containing protein [Phycisphaerales bacterium]|nr:LamG domain-containing protein [Phycisphaerales bacterium]
MKWIALLLSTSGQWTPAQLDGGPVLNHENPAMVGRVEGAARMLEVDGLPVLVLDGGSMVRIGDQKTIHTLPSEAFTVEAWVQIDDPQEWGGIVSALQDNGSFEKGWVLGTRKDRFTFALASEQYGDADGSMTYLTGPTPFKPGHWHHVAGTWDGHTQRLFVDGVLVAEDEHQEGPVRWPSEAPFTMGAYHDSNERYPMRGLLGPVSIQDGAVGSSPGEVDFRLLTSGPSEATSRPLVELALPGRQMRSFEGGRIPGEDSSRVVRLPKSTMKQDTLEVDLLLRLDSASGSGALAGAKSGAGDGWSIELERGVPVLHVSRADGEQLLPGSVPLDRGVWHLVQVQADATSATLIVDGVATMSRSLKGPLAGASHRHVVLGGRRADTAGGTLGLDVRAFNMYEGRRSPEQVGNSSQAALATLPPPPSVDVGPIVRMGTNDWMFHWHTPDGTEQVLQWSIDDGPVQTSPADAFDGWHTVYLEAPRQRASDDGFLQYQIVSRLETGETTRGPMHRVAISTDIVSGPKPGYVLVYQPAGLDDVLSVLNTDGRQITVSTDDAELVQAIRRHAKEAELGQGRLVVHRRTEDGLPYAPWLFNQIHVDHERLTGGELASLLELVRPEGGRISGVTGSPPEGFELTSAASDSDQRDTWERGVVPGARWWSRQYAGPGHTSCSEDDLVKGDLHVLWWGRPGPRPMLDRGARAPSPLASHGQLYVQGNRSIFCLDAYNGAPQWVLSIPDLRRTNVPRDTSNMAVDEHGYLHVAVGDDLLKFGRHGTLFETRSTNVDDREWGLVDPIPGGGWLMTLVPPDAVYRGAEGEWYDAGGAESWRVAGDALVRISPWGDEAWSLRPEGWILHSTIARDDQLVYFVEVPEVELATAGLLPQSVLAKQDLVCVNLETGEEQWRQPLDVGHFDRMTYVMLADDTVLVCGSSDKFHTLTFDAHTGDPGWARDHAWGRDHHGGPLQHPVVIDDIVYVETCAYDVHTGELLRRDIPQGRGCGTKTASNHLMAFRHHFHSFWDPQSNEWTQWTGTRGGCWLGLLPAGGMLLAPETSSGCSCTHAIQTSMAWIPSHLDHTVEGDD